MTSVEIVPFEDRHAPGVARLCTTVQWPSLTDPETVSEGHCTIVLSRAMPSAWLSSNGTMSTGLMPVTVGHTCCACAR